MDRLRRKKSRSPNRDIKRISNDKREKAIEPIFYSSKVKERVFQDEISLSSIRFSFFSAEEAERFSVCEVNDCRTEGNIHNTLSDPRMGTLNKKMLCETCNLNCIQCPGHYGLIKLNYPIPHPLCSKRILQFLKLFCFKCNRLIINEERISLLGFENKTNDIKLRWIFNEADKVEVCPHENCRNLLPEFKFEDDNYTYSLGKNKSNPLSYEQIHDLFKNIPDCDVKLMGLDPNLIHPKRLIITKLLVLPPCARPFVKSNNSEMDDDLTMKYADIIKANNRLADVLTSPKTGKDSKENQKKNLIETLVYHIRTLMDNTKGKARDIHGKRAIKSIKQRLVGKTGLIRGNMQGKRTDFNGRTVVGPEAFGNMEELTIPIETSKVLTLPVTVNNLNIDKLQHLVDTEKVNSIIRGESFFNMKEKIKSQDFDIYPGDKIKTLDGNLIDAYMIQLSKGKVKLQTGESLIRDGNVIIKGETIQFKLQVGDVVERHAMDGDWVVLNRQPTLWKGSMQAKKIKIRPGKTFRFSLACTQHFNADFDGDEMNCHIPQSLPAIAEVKELLTMSNHFVSCQDSKPPKIKQDTMTGVYKLTKGMVEIPRHLFYDCLSWFDIDKMFIRMDEIRSLLSKETNKKQNGTIKKVIKRLNPESEKEIEKIEKEIKHIEGLKNRAKTQATKDKHQKTIDDLRVSIDLHKLNLIEEEIIEHIDIENISQIIPEKEIYFGRYLFSCILPNDFNYSYEDVLIKNGVLLKGTLSSPTIGGVSGSISHHIYKDYGGKRAVQLISDLETLINCWLQHNGFSVGFEDCIPKNEQLCINETEKCMLEAYSAMESEKDPESMENKITGALNSAISLGQKLAKEALNEDNNLVTMISAGAKGNWFNISQTTGLVGQQIVKGTSRICKDFGGRTLPHFRRTSGYLYTAPDVLPKPTVKVDNIDDFKLKEAKRIFYSRGFITSSYFRGIKPHEYFFASAGGREGLTDTAVKSVTWDTIIIIMENSNIKYTTIGSYIDSYLDSNENKGQIEYTKEANMELLNIKRNNTYIPTCDETGNVSWGEVTAITRHDPGNELFEIKTLSGRNVIVTASKSLILWNENEQKFIPTLMKDVNIGDFVPVTMNLCNPPVIKDFINMENYFEKTEYIYGTDFNIAVNLMKNDMIGKHKIPQGWWNDNNYKTFTLPYSKKSSLQRAIIRSKTVRNGYIYPYDGNREDILLPDKFELNEENGIFIGLFLAEGNCDIKSNYIQISNNNKNIQNFVKSWFEKHNIHYKFYSKINKIGGLSESIRGNSIMFAKFFTKLLGHRAENKIIPNEAFSAPDSFIKGLLNGYFSGDGTISYNSVEVGSASENLIVGINILCNRLNIFGKFFTTKLKSNNLNTQNIKTTYRYAIRSSWASIFAEKIQLIDDTKQIKLNNIKPTKSHKNYQSKNDIILDSITEINPISPDKYPKMYDLTIPSTLNFGIASGLQLRDTASTGYIQRKITKVLEDIQISYSGSVVSATNKIIQFSYGGDNLDASKLIKTKNGMSFVDAKHIAETLNNNYENL